MNQYYVISHTHWDREWYMSLELMRLRLVDLVDHCLEILADNSDYIFHLDAQTIVLEDYLSIRPDRRGDLEKYIAEGRLIVGPWYLQNDFYLTSGEATVRNLIEGRRIANAFGACSKVGYCPDQFGLISQLPQILNNFGIESCIFGRGAAKVITDQNGQPKRVPFPLEFIWMGAPGSSVTGIHMSRWYNNAQRFSDDIDKALKLVEMNEQDFGPRSVTPFRLLMNGVDHLEAQEDLLPILDQLNARMAGCSRIFQSTLDQYISDFQEYVRENHIKLPEHRGELRQGGDWELLKGTLSSRIYLKQKNVAMQDRIQKILEPLYTMLESAGMAGVYSKDHFRYIWRELLKNHPHDSICGCSRDEVHDHMEDNFARLDEMTGEMLRRGLDFAANHIDPRLRVPADYGILVVNTLQCARNAVVYAVVDLPKSEQFEGFSVYAPNGEPVEFSVLSKRQTVKNIFSPINLPGGIDVDRYEIALLVKDLSPFSMRRYTIKKSEKPNFIAQPQQIGMTEMENEFLRVHVSDDGSVDIFDKKNGRTISDALLWEDTADTGDSYVYLPGNDAPILGRDFSAQIEAEKTDPFTQVIKIRKTLSLPQRYDFNRKQRTGERVQCNTELILTLRQGDAVLGVSYTIDNKAEDHRLRLYIRTGMSEKQTFADTPYDLLRRDQDGHYFETHSKVYPNSSFVGQENGDFGTVVFTCGQHEYEHLQGENGDIIALTVLRCTGVISRDIWSGKENGDQWDCPGNQCLRRIEGRIGLMLYRDIHIGELPTHASAFRNPPAAYFFSQDPRKFIGGRPAVQDSAVAQLFYREDPYPDAKIVSDCPFLTVNGKGIVVEAIKKAEDGKGYILRFWNAADEAQEYEINLQGNIFRSNMAEEKGELLSKDYLKIRLEQREIVSLLVCNE